MIPRPPFPRRPELRNITLTSNFNACLRFVRPMSSNNLLRHKNTDMASNFSIPSNYSSWTHQDLIDRITSLEAQLRAQTTNYKHHLQSQAPPSFKTSSRSLRRRSPFDPSKYATRHIALKFAYLGTRYNGYEHANGNTTSLPTIEEVLWKALRKARLISPPSVENNGTDDESIEVVWDTSQRLENGALEISWEGCQYSKCGRTDRGVSAFGQVVGVRVRSKRPLEPSRVEMEPHMALNGKSGSDDLDSQSAETPPIGGETDFSHVGRDMESSASFDSIDDELPYISILNSILPTDIRILGWCPHPPVDFDARFSCKERRYKYFFTNPAILPTPGPLGFEDAHRRRAKTREGWLDIEAMQEATKKLVGLHDFRNFCKIDPSKQMTDCKRRITYATIEESEQQGGLVSISSCASLRNDAKADEARPDGALLPGQGPRVYSFTVHGSAFLWHQVRHMAAVIFLVGQGLEAPSIVDELIDIESNPGRPSYEMASDDPLVLWDCSFSDENDESGEDALDWIYAGDTRSLPALTIKSDGKFGVGGVVSELWNQWRKHKMDEILSGSLLDLVIRQGDGSAMARGGFRDTEAIKVRSQKLFDGHDSARMVGTYIPVMQKSRLDSIDVQNARYRAGKGGRRELKRSDARDTATEE